MYKDSYNQRLKEIRQKYGSSVKDTTTCLRSVDKQSLKLDSKYQDKYNDKYTVNKKNYQNYPDRKYVENIDPSLTSLSSKYSSSILKTNESSKKYDSFLYTQDKQERLKQIEKIRQNFKESRKQAQSDFNRQVQKSKSKINEEQKYGVLKQRVNSKSIYNPEDFKIPAKQKEIKENHRGRTQSSYSLLTTKPDIKLGNELRRNYDYNYDYETSIKDNKINVDQKNFVSYRNNSVSRLQKDCDNFTTENSYGYNDNFRSMKLIDSQTTSPIRGLMKFDSLQKAKKTQISQNQFTLTKLATNTYDLGNIDKIQQRIQKILTKK